MKIYVLWTVCLLGIYTCTSQNLKPIVQHIDTEPYLCFNTTQSRFIASQLEHGVFQKTLLDTLEIQQVHWQRLLEKKEGIILTLERKVLNFEQQLAQDKTHINNLNKSLKVHERKSKHRKLERWLFGSGMLILTGVLIAQ